jgi:PAS domain-containing protein
LKKKDSAPFWVRLESSIAPDENGSPVCCTMVSDINECKQAEEGLRKTLQQLELITENMEAGVTRCSRDLRYLWVSRSYASLLSWSREDITGRPISEVIDREGFETKLPHFARVLSGEREEYEAQLTTMGTGARLIHAVYVPTRDHNHQQAAREMVQIATRVHIEARSVGDRFWREPAGRPRQRRTD